MKIALCVPSWPPGSSPNGIVTYAAQIVPALRRLGHEVFVLTPSGESGADHYVIDIRPYERPLSLWQRLRVRLSHDAAFDAATAPLVRAVKDLIARHQIEVIEIEESFGWSESISRLKTIPVVVRLHGPWFLNRRSNTKKTRLDLLREKWEGRALQSAQAVTSPSRTTLEMVTSRYNLKQRGFFIANPIGPASGKWSLADCDTSSMIYVGRFDQIKGGDLVIDAFARLASINPNLKLIFIGPDGGIGGEKLMDYARRVLSPDALARMSYFGPLPQSEIAALRTKHFLTLCASRFEVFGYTVLEAMATGCPIVASDVGGIPELIQSGDNGLLFDPQNLADMVAAIQKMLDHPLLAEQMGARARQRSREHFSTEQAAARSAEIYRQEIEKFSSRRTKTQG